MVLGRDTGCSMNFIAAAQWLGVLGLIGAVLFARMGMLRDYLIGVAIALVILILVFGLESLGRSLLHL